MATPFLGEIKIVGFNFAPKGWALCNGQLLPINQNQALFSLFGTTYGGDGRTNFALPDLRGRVPIHVGNNHTQGERAGEEAHTLSINEMPVHNHTVNAVAPNDSSGNTNLPANALLSNTAPAELYASGQASLSPVAQTISIAGGSQPHENRQPFLVLNFIVALQGIFPSPN
ncbi:MAG: phage tail protein [Saprospiraceae bacterium]|nr:phage tail protein [Saprospiraceae bacterium]